MLKNAVYVLAAIGLIFVTIIIGIGWDVASKRGQPAPEPDWAQQIDSVTKICEAFAATPDGLSCHLAAGDKTIKATLLRYPVGGTDAWCSGYRTVIRRAGISLPGWTLQTYVDGTPAPVISCLL